MYCKKCNKSELNLECPRCLKFKIKKIELDRDNWKDKCKFYKNELELIQHG